MSVECRLKMTDCGLQDQESEGALAFKKAASGIDDIPFGITSDDSVFKEHKVDKDSVVLFKKVRQLLSCGDMLKQKMRLFFFFFFFFFLYCFTVKTFCTLGVVRISVI